MAREIPESAVRLVASFFDPATVESAVDVARSGRVHLVKPPPFPVVAQVRGSEGYVVTVHYAPGTAYLRGDCSCSVAVDCKHAAATALVAFARDGESAARRLDSAREVAVGRWLADFGRHQATAAQPETDRVVAYLIDAGDGGLGVTAMHCAPLRRGGLGQGALIGGHGDPHRAPPAWIGGDDLRRLALLRAVTRAAPHVTRMPLARVHGELLRDLAASGHLHWESTRSAPLTYGPRLTATLGWQPVPSEPDAFRLGLAGDLVIAPAHECHYIDPAAARIGPLELGVPAELVLRLTSAPPVPAAMRATVERSLVPLMDAPALAAHPPGSAPAIVASPGEPADLLRPRMTASIRRDSTEGAAVEVVGEAVYGDEVFVLAEWDPERPRPRDLVGEGRLHARLQALLAGLPHGAGASTSMELLADARHIAHSVMPRLRLEGWSCELSPDFPHEAPLVDVQWVEQIQPINHKHT